MIKTFHGAHVLHDGNVGTVAKEIRRGLKIHLFAYFGKHVTSYINMTTTSQLSEDKCQDFAADTGSHKKLPCKKWFMYNTHFGDIEH